MPLIKTEGIILQQRPFSETSKILVAYTGNKGKVSLLFKGGRKGVKKFPGGLETLNRVELQYYHKDSRNLQNFKSFDLIDTFSDMRADFSRMYTALSIGETILRTTADEEENADLYNYLIQTFEALNLYPNNPWTLRWKSLLDVSRSLGFGFSLGGCIGCDKKGTIKSFDLSAGGFLCDKHKIDPSHVVPSSGEVWGVLRFLGQCPFEAAPRMVVNAITGRKIEALFLRYFRYHVPTIRSFESWKILDEVYWGKGK
ncbi:DNA repair protein RecO [candidate division LCP-89 bacterium B3_LCP]|uniref:DNA repair protein RecO n=1 Tax=candidate division LCP-89 bacterium B3_LCP TaxID=2012998 RepID=A0A532V1L2_UNCL8|nr:MAG: DNA repair protein RecO [candidate division LCP-89 bacterium B3_LCP]